MRRRDRRVGGGALGAAPRCPRVGHRTSAAEPGQPSMPTAPVTSSCAARDRWARNASAPCARGSLGTRGCRGLRHQLAATTTGLRDSRETVRGCHSGPCTCREGISVEPRTAVQTACSHPDILPDRTTWRRVLVRVRISVHGSQRRAGITSERRTFHLSVSRSAGQPQSATFAGTSWYRAATRQSAELEVVGPERQLVVGHGHGAVSGQYTIGIGSHRQLARQRQSDRKLTLARALLLQPIVALALASRRRGVETLRVRPDLAA